MQIYQHRFLSEDEDGISGWLHMGYEESSNVKKDKISVADLYQVYLKEFCLPRCEEPKRRCEFGKFVRKAFPGIRIRRLGPAYRQVSFYCGIAKKGTASQPLAFRHKQPITKTDQRKNAGKQKNQSDWMDFEFDIHAPVPKKPSQSNNTTTKPQATKKGFEEAFLDHALPEEEGDDVIYEEETVWRRHTTYHGGSFSANPSTRASMQLPFFNYNNNTKQHYEEHAVIPPTAYPQQYHSPQYPPSTTSTTTTTCYTTSPYTGWSTPGGSLLDDMRAPLQQYVTQNNYNKQYNYDTQYYGNFDNNNYNSNNTTYYDNCTQWQQQGKQHQQAMPVHRQEEGLDAFFLTPSFLPAFDGDTAETASCLIS